MDVTFRRLTIAAVLVLLAGCASTQNRADRAFEAENYQEALGGYEQVIDGGTDDWEVYYRAAKAATHLGNFAVAEKYYSHALRKGGGAEVAREFASFYLKTSNYSRAVRLLQFLLEVEDDKQPIYNNIGTALMYAGAPLDAETYLLVAQQMAPDDPIPYVNLGVLYERHLRKPEIAVDFYRCYLDLAGPGHSQRERIESRVSEIGGRGRGESRSQFECGEPYYPGGGPRRADLEEEMNKLGAEAPGNGGHEEGEPIELGLGPEADASSEESGPTGSFEKMGEASASDESPDRNRADAGVGGAGETGTSRGDGARHGGGPSDAGAAENDASDGSTGEVGGGPTIERAGETPKRPEQPSPTIDGEASDADRAAILERARAAYADEDYQTVVDEIGKLSLRQLNIAAMRIYGLSLARLGENEDARQWLEWVVDRKPDPESVAVLIVVYERLGRDDARNRICERFRKRDDYGDARQLCPSPVEKPDREKLRDLQLQRRDQ